MSREIFDLPPYSEIWKDTKKRTPLSKERELLREIMGYIASGVVSITSNDLGDAAETLHEIKELLAQPEQKPTTRHALDSYWNQEAYQRGYARAEIDLKREPLSDGATADMWHANKKATHADSYWAGVYDAEKAHGIGVDDE